MESNYQLLNLLITVISGVLVFVISQLFVEFVLRPIQEYKKLKAKAAKLLVYYANCYTNPRRDVENCTKHREGSNAFRELASEVEAFTNIMPWRGFVFFAIPSTWALLEARGGLIGFSNSFFLSEGFSMDLHLKAIEKYEGDVGKNMGLASYKQEQKRKRK